MFRCLIQTHTASVVAIDGCTVISGKIGGQLEHCFHENTLLSEAEFERLKGNDLWWEADIPVGTSAELEYLLGMVHEVRTNKMKLVCNNQALMDGLWEVLFAFGEKNLVELRPASPFEGQRVSVQPTRQSPWRVRLTFAYHECVRTILGTFRLTA